MLTSGSVRRCSNSVQAAKIAAEAMSSPTTRPEPQPQLFPRLMASSRQPSAAASPAAPGQSIRAGDLTGDSGTKRWVATMATTKMK